MATEAVKPTEIFEENVRMKERVDHLQRENKRLAANKTYVCVDDDVEGTFEDSDVDIDKHLRRTIHVYHEKAAKRRGINLKSLVKYVVICLIGLAVVSALIVIQVRQTSVLESLKVSQNGNPQQLSYPGVLPVGSQQLSSDQNGAIKDVLQKYYLNIGMRQDYQLQECQGPEFKQSFPDIDYVFLGYNILKGFPLSVGHDPGFSYPLFKADYSKGHQTADCRYSVPQGLVVIPDVSCVTSFSSTTVQNKYEFSKSLSVSASVSGGGWGVSFSASAGYKQSSSEMATGEYVFILSTASCNYYYSKLVADNAPKFDDVFLNWIYKLNATNETANPLDTETTYFTFFETFGTHFPTEVTFGARFTYEHKMSSKLYQTQQSKEVNVAVQASYSGLFSVGGGFNMDSSQRQAASDFSKNVTTKTITVGAAPPANGDAMTWASEVKTSPVPTAYQLSSIEQLFTERFMGHLNVDLERIRHTIDGQKQKYCLSLLKQGKLETCQDIVAGIEIKNTRMYDHYRELVVASVSECIETCLQEVLCEATTFCLTCDQGEFGYKTCFLYKQLEYETSAGEDEKNDWQSNIFTEKIKSELEFVNTGIVGNPRGFENTENKRSELNRCRQLCIKDAYCVAFTHCACPEKDAQCQLYSKEQVRQLQKEPGTSTFFISNRQAETTTKTTTTTTMS